MSVIIDIDHEAGDLTEYSSTVTDGGHMSVAAAAALASTSYGLSCSIQDTTAMYGVAQLGSGNTSGVHRVRFYIDPNTLTMANNNRFVIYVAYTYAGSWIVNCEMLYTTVGGYQIRMGMIDDANTAAYSSSYAISDAPHWIEIELKRAASSTSNDGSAQLWIDDTSKETITGKDNYDKFVNFGKCYLGPSSGIDTGTSGTLYLDQLVVRDDSTQIGAHSTAISLTMATASLAGGAQALNVMRPVVLSTGSLVGGAQGAKVMRPVPLGTGGLSAAAQGLKVQRPVACVTATLAGSALALSVDVGVVSVVNVSLLTATLASSGIGALVNRGVGLNTSTLVASPQALKVMRPVVLLTASMVGAGESLGVVVLLPVNIALATALAIVAGGGLLVSVESLLIKADTVTVRRGDAETRGVRQAASETRGIYLAALEIKGIRQAASETKGVQTKDADQVIYG